MLENLTYFLNGASLSFFAMGAFHMAIYARQSKSRPHYLFTICLIWMALIELKEFFLSHDAAYNYEILGPGFTFPDLYEGENETYIEASAENSGSILYDKEIRDKPRTRRTKRNV